MSRLLWKQQKRAESGEREQSRRRRSHDLTHSHRRRDHHHLGPLLRRRGGKNKHGSVSTGKKGRLCVCVGSKKEEGSG